jgi:predicted DNA-binding transcriptional regulator YafY
VPVWSERGRNGGFSIDPGWGARIAGLTEPETQALLVAGVPRIATDLGLGESALNGRLKVLSSLPRDMRAQAERFAARLHVDPTDWYRADEHAEHLDVIAHAIWCDEAIAVRYRSWRSERDRELEPLGLVLKAGVWYVLARASGDAAPRIYRAVNILRVTPSGRVFARPPGFDLAAVWRDNVARFERELERVHARIEVSELGLSRMRNARMRVSLDDGRVAPADDGWRMASVALESIDAGARQLLAFGPELRVREPRALRDELARSAAAVAALNRHDRAA